MQCPALGGYLILGASGRLVSFGSESGLIARWEPNSVANIITTQREQVPF